MGVLQVLDRRRDGASKTVVIYIPAHKSASSKSSASITNNKFDIRYNNSNGMSVGYVPATKAIEPRLHSTTNNESDIRYNNDEVTSVKFGFDITTKTG